MIGAIIGDIVGSRFEWHNHRSKCFEFFSPKCFATDDSIMSLAICDALLRCDADPETAGAAAVEAMQRIGRPFPHCGFGGRFFSWIYSDTPRPYNSYGNGAAMRVSACAYAATSLDQAKALSKAVTEVTHNHHEGLKGAEATTVAVYLARTGQSLPEIRDYITTHYYTLDFTLDSIRATYRFNETCQETVPQALQAFFEADSFEDAIRSAISIGGDSDTLAAITGSIAGAFYPIPTPIRTTALSYLNPTLSQILLSFESKYPGRRFEI